MNNNSGHRLKEEDLIFSKMGFFSLICGKDHANKKNI